MSDGNQVEVFGGVSGLPQTADDFLQALQTMVGGIQGGGGGPPLLRLIKEGIFVYGQENIEVEEGSLWALNPASMEHGWACWDDGQLLGEQMVPFNLPQPRRDALPDYGPDREWKQQVSARMKCRTGEDVDVEVLYKGTSLGQRNAFKELIIKIMQRVKQDPGHFVPVVELNMDSYQHKKYGKTFFPVLDLYGFMSMSGENALDWPAPVAASQQPATAAAAAQPAPAQPAAPAVAATPAPAVAPPVTAAAAPPAAAAPAPEVRRRRRAVQQ